MKYSKVENRDALLLVRSMGLLLNQAAVYGPVHNVTKSAINRVYEEVFENLSRYRALEFTVKSNVICVNGFSGDVDSVVSSNFVRRLAQLDINGLLFTYPLPVKEFERCIKILAMPIALVAEASGVAALFKAERLTSVAVVKIDYKRVDGVQAGEELDAGFSDSAFQLEIAPKTSAGGVIDLSDELDDVPELSFDLFDAEAAADKLAREREERKRQSEALASLLRATAETLEARSEISPEMQYEQVVAALEHVKAALLVMTKGSEISISALAQQVHEDKSTVAGIEQEARMRGCNLKLTREELLTRYAELNQEIVQPLTVSTGVIDMLRQEQAGIVNESQQELLKMASESIERVNQLVAFMHGIAGLPESLNPDMTLIGDSYGS